MCAVLQGLTWRCSVYCAQNASRPRRPCSSTWRSTPACTATSAATASAPSPATPPSKGTCARTQVSRTEPLPVGRAASYTLLFHYIFFRERSERVMSNARWGEGACVYFCIWVNFLRLQALSFSSILHASSPSLPSPFSIR